jgi:hypothetical protein
MLRRQHKDDTSLSQGSTPGWISHLSAVAATMLGCALLAACRGEVSGSPTPPAEFGAVSRTLFGCPAVQGVYAWPPSAGTYSKGMATNQEPWEGGIPVPARRGPMQIWVTQSGTAVVFRSRSARRMAGLRDRLLTEWSYAEHHRGSFSCSRGTLDVEPVDVETTEDFGGKGIRRGFKLAVMKDGSLAVGIQTVVYGRTGSLFAWGDVHRGSIPLPDKTIWRWSKLSRTASGDKEPDPVDAESPSSGTNS